MSSWSLPSALMLGQSALCVPSIVLAAPPCSRLMLNEPSLSLRLL
jgi:hypothetical protein